MRAPARALLVPVCVAFLLMAACSSNDDGSGGWETVQSGSEGGRAWTLYRIAFSLPGGGAPTTCVAFESDPPVLQRPASDQAGVPRDLEGKQPVCAVPGSASGSSVVHVLSSNLEATEGLHDVVGVAEPEVTDVSATFDDGSTAQAAVQGGIFVVTWTGPKTLSSVMALSGGSRPAGECVRVGDTAGFTCTG